MTQAVRCQRLIQIGIIAGASMKAPLIDRGDNRPPRWVTHNAG